MIYPFENAAQEETEAQEEVYIPKEYGINFETGQLSGRVVEGLEAVKVWAWLALQTARQRYYIYSTDYGQEYEDLIGKSYSKEYTDMELKRMTEECLLINPYITGIEDFEVTKAEDCVELSFKMVTLLGDEEVKTVV